MKKVLIVQYDISHYNVPLYEYLSKKYELTVLHTNPNISKDSYCFKTQYVKSFDIRGRKVFKTSFYKLFNKYDVVICTLAPWCINARVVCYLPRKFRLLYWGIGVAASYTTRFDCVEIPQFEKMINKADGTIFYTDYAKKKYQNKGINEKKLFVANNTVEVLTVDRKTQEIILFVGSLYKEKRLDILLEMYEKAFLQEPSIEDLFIVGKGDIEADIISYISSKKLDNKIHLCGEILDENELKKLFSRAVMCISPDQAGLSVLKSMGYGVPFVTHKNAITGGERLNIKDGENGILFNSFDEIPDIILEAHRNKEKYILLGNNAKSYYYSNCTLEKMAEAFIDAIEYN